jgi:hypothetical protein
MEGEVQCIYSLSHSLALQPGLGIDLAVYIYTAVKIFMTSTPTLGIWLTLLKKSCPTSGLSLSSVWGSYVKKWKYMYIL